MGESSIIVLSTVVMAIATIFIALANRKSATANERLANLQEQVNELSKRLSIYDAARLHAEIEKLFRYARSETEHVDEPVQRADVERVLFFFGLEKQVYPSVYDLVARRLP